MGIDKQEALLTEFFLICIETDSWNWKMLVLANVMVVCVLPLTVLGTFTLGTPGVDMGLLKKIPKAVYDRSEPVLPWFS